MKNIQQLQETYSRLLQELEDDIDGEDIAQEVYDLEMEVTEQIERRVGKEKLQLKSLLMEIKELKEDFDIHNPDAELDRMFPNRRDDDFDEDSMSYDSVFGDD
jgi:hypothetical protein